MLLFCAIKNGWKDVKFDEVKINKRKFHASKESIIASSVNADKIVMSTRFKHGDESLQYFISYRGSDIVRPLVSIMLPQMSGYIKYFDNCGKNMSFVIEDDNVLEIWNKIKELIGKKFHSEPIYDNKYIL